MVCAHNCILTFIFLILQVGYCHHPPHHSPCHLFATSVFSNLVGKWLTGVSESVIMDKEIERIRTIAEACDLSGQELVDFVRSERSEQERMARDERAYQLELRRQDRELMEMKLRLEEIKHEDSNSSTSGTANNQSSSVRAPKLPPFDDTKDDIDAYLQRFERYAVSQNWDEKVWAVNLSALLKGKALDVYSRLSLEDASNYPSLRDALLKRFHLTAYGFQQKFRTAKPEANESAPQFSVRLDNALTRWFELSKCKKTYEGVKDLLLREQFLNSIDQSLSIFLKERDPKSISEMSRLAEQYCEAHGGFGIQQVRKQNPQSSSRKPFESRPPQHRPSDSFSKLSLATGTCTQRDRNRTTFTCYNCGKPGHIAKDCRVRPKGITKVANVIASALTDLFSSDDPVSQTSTQSDDHCTTPSKKQSDETSYETVACMMTHLSSTNEHECSCTKNGFVTLICGNTLPIMSAACRDKNPACMPVTDGYVNDKSVKVLRDTGCSGIVVRKSLVLDSQLTGQVKSFVLADGTLRQAPVAKVDINTPYFVGYSEVLCLQNPVYDLIIGNIDNARDPRNPDLNWSLREDDLDCKTVDTCMQTDDHRSCIETSAVQTRSQTERSEKPLKKLKVPTELPEIDRNHIKEA